MNFGLLLLKSLVYLTHLSLMVVSDVRPVAPDEPLNDYRDTGIALDGDVRRRCEDCQLHGLCAGGCR